MAQLVTTLHVDLELHGTRKQVKRALAETQEANRGMARLEEKLERLRSELAEHGIHLEVD